MCYENNRWTWGGKRKEEGKEVLPKGGQLFFPGDTDEK